MKERDLEGPLLWRTIYKKIITDMAEIENRYSWRIVSGFWNCETTCCVIYSYMYVNERPWQQVYLWKKNYAPGWCVNRKQYHIIEFYVLLYVVSGIRLADWYSNVHISISINELLALKEMQIGQGVFLWYISFFISGIFSRRRDYHQITGMVSVFW